MSFALLRRVAVLAALWGGLSRCTQPPPKPEPQGIEPSPNASILPAPLENVLPSGQRQVLQRDAGLPDAAFTDAGSSAPEFLREDRPLEPDVLLRDSPQLRVHAELQWLDLPPFPKLPESNGEAIQRLRESLTFTLKLEFSSIGRMRVVFDSPAFVLPVGTELRARQEYFGHLLFWNAGQRYTALRAGTLRAVLNEQRADAAPLTKPKIRETGQGQLLGVRTSKRVLETPLGRLLLEQGNIANAGAGAPLLCRLLAELIAADPSDPACLERELILRAELFSAGGGHVLFEVRKLERDALVEAQLLLVPPITADFAPGQLPVQASALVPSAERLQELRLRPTPRTERPDPSAPKQGLLLQNRTESLRYVLLDGVVLARVLPRRDVHVEGLLPGKYALASLDFLGDDPTPLRIVELPARVALGEEIEHER